MKVCFLPKTKSGKVSAFLFILSVVIFIVFSILPYKEGYTGMDIVVNNPLQFMATIFIFILGISASLLGIYSVIKNKEYSIIVFLIILAGLYNVVSLIGVIVNILF